MSSHRLLLSALALASSLSALAQAPGSTSGPSSGSAANSGFNNTFNNSANGSANNGNNSSNAGGNNGPAPMLIATDPGYRLSIGDEIAVNIHGEDDMSAAQRIDKKGGIRMPILIDVNLSNKTVREAEAYIEQLLIDRKLLRRPLVNITVRDYASREVQVIGAVGSPGNFRLRSESDSMDIVDLIVSVGNFRATAKGDKVKVIRTDDEGRKTDHIINVEAMIKGKKDGKKDGFLIYPGDRIIVDERMW